MSLPRGRLHTPPKRKSRRASSLVPAAALCLACLMCVLVAIRAFAEMGSSTHTLEEAAGFRPHRDARLLEHIEQRYIPSGVKDLTDALQQMHRRLGSDMADLGIAHAIPSVRQKARLLREFTGFSDFCEHMQRHSVPRRAWPLVFKTVRDSDVRSWARCMD